jgi:hypothetical protein
LPAKEISGRPGDGHCLPETTVLGVCVSTIILNTKTKEYLREGEWIADRSLAQSFRNVDYAVHYRFKHVLKVEMQVIF